MLIPLDRIERLASPDRTCRHSRRMIVSGRLSITTSYDGIVSGAYPHVTRPESKSVPVQTGSGVQLSRWALRGSNPRPSPCMGETKPQARALTTDSRVPVSTPQYLGVPLRCYARSYASMPQTQPSPAPWAGVCAAARGVLIDEQHRFGVFFRRAQARRRCHCVAHGDGATYRLHDPRILMTSGSTSSSGISHGRSVCHDRLGGPG